MSDCACFHIVSPPWIGSAPTGAHADQTDAGRSKVVLLAVILPAGGCTPEVSGLQQYFTVLLRGALSAGDDNQRDHAAHCRCARQLLRQPAPESRPAGEPVGCELTPHEARLLKLLVEGHHYKTAAVALGVSRHTVSFHLRRLYQKLDVHSKAEAVSKALRHGLV